jgi:hypothetical protein
MEGLFEAILGNPLLLFFIIAALLSFFQGLGGKNDQGRGQGQGQGPQQQEHRRAETQEDEIDWREIFRQEQFPDQEHPTERQPRAGSGSTQSQIPAEDSVAVKTEAEKERNKANRELYEKYERAKQRKEQVAKDIGEIGDSPIMQGEIRDVIKPKIALNFSKVSREEVIKGVVWSEILSRPKSGRVNK